MVGERGKSTGREGLQEGFRERGVSGRSGRGMEKRGRQTRMTSARPGVDADGAKKVACSRTSKTCVCGLARNHNRTP